MPNTRSFGNPAACLATWHIASSGLVTTTTIESGDCSTAARVTAPTMFSFVATRSSRLMPGERGLPEVTTTTSDPAVAS